MKPVYKILTLCLLLLIPFKGSALDDVKTIVYVGSYHENHLWMQPILEATSDVLYRAGYKVKFRTIYLNAKEINDPAVREMILNANLFQIQEKVDLVIVAGLEASQHVITSNHQLLNGDTPIILGTYVEKTISSYKRDNICSISVSLNISGLYATARQMFPNATKIYIWNDKTNLGRFFDEKLKERLKEFENDIEINYSLNASSEEEFLSIAKSIDPNSIVILGSWQQDDLGRRVDPEVFYFELADASPAPVFLLTEDVIENTQFIGGYILSPYKLGDELGKEAIAIFRGKTPLELGREYISCDPIFDWAAIKAHGGLKSAIPRGAIVKNSFMGSIRDNYRFFIFIFAIALFLLILFLQFRYKSLLKRSLLREQENKKLIEEFDVTRQNLQKALSDAQQADSLKSTFLANMSHEIRTPLNAIVGFSDLLVSAESQEERGEYIKIVKSNNELLLRLINDILDFSRIESGNIDIINKEFDLAKCMEERLKIFQGQAIYGVKMVCELPCDSYMFNSDKRRVTQITSNFLANAVKFTRQGSITFGFTVENNGVRIFCTDTGKGIAKENTEKIFMSFEKGGSFVQGIGLSICRSIVLAMKGNIGVDSKLGEGSTFWAWIPDNNKV